MLASGILESAERTTPGPLTPTLRTQSASPTPWKAPAIKGLSSTALQKTTIFAAPKQWLSLVASEACFIILPIRATASILIPALVEPTLTEEHTFDVSASASGIEFISSRSPAAKPF
jgi:hypothetical protein